MGTCRENRKKSERGFEVKPPLILLSVGSFALNMGNRGSQEQQDAEGRCCTDGVHFVNHISKRLIYTGIVSKKSLILAFTLFFSLHLPSLPFPFAHSLSRAGVGF